MMYPTVQSRVPMRNPVVPANTPVDSSTLSCHWTLATTQPYHASSCRSSLALSASALGASPSRLHPRHQRTSAQRIFSDFAPHVLCFKVAPLRRTVVHRSFCVSASLNGPTSNRCLTERPPGNHQAYVKQQSSISRLSPVRYEARGGGGGGRGYGYGEERRRRDDSDRRPRRDSLGYQEPRRQVRERSPEVAWKVSPILAVALLRLLRIENDGAYIDRLGDDTDGHPEGGLGGSSWSSEAAQVEALLGVKVPPLDPRSRRNVTEIVAGVTRWKRYLDFLIANYYRHRKGGTLLEDMEPILRQTLRMGIYEIVKLGRASYAATSEAVDLAKVALRPAAGGLVNGLLRQVVEANRSNALPRPDVGGGQDSRQLARGLATVHSHPVWLVRRWLDRFGQEEAEQLMVFNNKRPTFGLRANPGPLAAAARKAVAGEPVLKGAGEEGEGGEGGGTGMVGEVGEKEAVEMLLARLEELGVQAERSQYLDNYLRVQAGLQDIRHSGIIQGGLCSVQDEAAGLVVCVLDPCPGEEVVDLCAAPGTKTTAIAGRVGGLGRVLAVDPNPARLQLVKQAAASQGVGNIVETVVGDARELARDWAKKGEVIADRVLVDAPCSGTGTMAKNADLRWNRMPKDLEELVMLQDDLLEAGSVLVRPGGVLVYSTCSIEREENEACVEAFLARHPEFSVESVSPYVPPQMVTDKGFYAALPQRDGIDGAFAARLRRRDLGP